MPMILYKFIIYLKPLGSPSHRLAFGASEICIVAPAALRTARTALEAPHWTKRAVALAKVCRETSCPGGPVLEATTVTDPWELENPEGQTEIESWIMLDLISSDALYLAHQCPLLWGQKMACSGRAQFLCASSDWVSGSQGFHKNLRVLVNRKLSFGSFWGFKNLGCSLANSSNSPTAPNHGEDQISPDMNSP